MQTTWVVSSPNTKVVGMSTLIEGLSRGLERTVTVRTSKPHSPFIFLEDTRQKVLLFSVYLQKKEYK